LKHSELFDDILQFQYIFCNRLGLFRSEGRINIKITVLDFIFEILFR